MYIAEIRGKLSSRVEHQEDILTSNVFSFFKYADRKNYLRPYLNSILMEFGARITEKDAEKAQFLFWPSYDDKTEPDVVIIVGRYYILFEAKYSSDFAKKTELSKDQLSREMEKGSQAAKNFGKQFFIVAVTADYNEPKEKFDEIKKLVKFKWINWQFITLFLEKRLKENIKNKEFSEDLYKLLIKRNLRNFNGFLDFKIEKKIRESEFVFFEYKQAKHRGVFIGFLDAFTDQVRKIDKHESLFYKIVES